MFFTEGTGRGGVCPDRRALWHESEYGEDIPVPHEEKATEISGAAGNCLVRGREDERAKQRKRRKIVPCPVRCGGGITASE